MKQQIISLLERAKENGRTIGDVLAEVRGMRPVCLTCDDHGAVGNILDTMPCPDCASRPATHAAAPAEGLPNLPQLLRENADLDAAEGGNPDVAALEWAAADEIERLRREVSKLRAPVAGEAIQKAKHDTANAETERERVMALAYWLDQQTFEPGMLSCAAATLRAMFDRDAAPQASEAVRNVVARVREWATEKNVKAFPRTACAHIEGLSKLLLASGQRTFVDLNHPIFAFLLGEGTLRGVEFGDPHPEERGAYWWRKDLRAALASATVAGEAVATVRGSAGESWKGDATIDLRPGLALAAGTELFLAHAAPQASPAADERDAAFEAVRKRFCKLPRSSFFIGPKPFGGVQRVDDTSGRWVEFDAVHELFDPVAVDAAIAAQQGDKTGANSGHGHVWERPDGLKARCGGPGFCAQCSRDQAAQQGEGGA